MHKDLKPDQVALVIGSPAVNDEFSRKIKELDRRLQANGMYYRDWESMNDRQHEIFSHDMFLDGDSAVNVESYVRGAVDSCWCPDVVEDLHHHSPVLMREIEKQQEMLPDMKVNIGENLSLLNEIIDEILLEFAFQTGQSLPSNLPKPGLTGKGKKKPNILTTQGRAYDIFDPVQYEDYKNLGCRYETEIISVMNSIDLHVDNYYDIDADDLGFEGADGDGGACDDATGADAQFFIDGKPYDLEIKLDAKAPMGSTSVKIWPLRPSGGGEGKMFEFAKTGSFEGDDIQNKVYDALQSREKLILSFIDDLVTPDWTDAAAWKKGKEPATPFKSTIKGFKRAMANKTIPLLDKQGNPVLNKTGKDKGKPKLNSQMNMTGKKGVAFPDTSFILQHYGKKGIDYIQIGGKGLYYLSSNPANLPVPQLANVGLVVELRPGKGGTVKNKKTGRYKKFPSDTGQGHFFKASAPLRISARLDGKSLAESPYTLDDPDSIVEMMIERERRLNKQQPQEEPEQPQVEPEEPEQPQVEPEESEET